MKLAAITEVQLKTPLTNLARNSAGGVLAGPAINDLITPRTRIRRSSDTTVHPRKGQHNDAGKRK